MTDVRIVDRDAAAKLVGKALNYLRYIEDIRQEAREAGIVLVTGSWYDAPREAFDLAGDDGCEVTEWQGFREDGRVYWSKRVEAFDIFTTEPPGPRSKAPERVETKASAGQTPVITSDICDDCGDRRWLFVGDPSGGSDLRKACERCGKERAI